jgi:hypothetical protein
MVTSLGLTGLLLPPLAKAELITTVNKTRDKIKDFIETSSQISI